MHLIYVGRQGEKAGGLIQQIAAISKIKEKAANMLVRDLNIHFGDSNQYKKADEKTDYEVGVATTTQFNVLYKMVVEMKAKADEFAAKIKDVDGLSEFLAKERSGAWARAGKVINFLVGKNVVGDAGKKALSEEVKKAYRFDFTSEITASDEKWWKIKFIEELTKRNEAIGNLYREMKGQNAIYNEIVDQKLTPLGYRMDISMEEALSKISSLAGRVEKMLEEFDRTRESLEKGKLPQKTFDDLDKKVNELGEKIEDAQTIQTRRSNILTLQRSMLRMVNAAFEQNLTYDQMRYKLAEFARYAA